VHLLMKPTLEQHDGEWKVVARQHIKGFGELLAAFDNEPTHINSYHEHFPEALCVHLLTDDSARGGEAIAERQAFEGLPQSSQEAVLEFLRSLQVLPTGTKATVVDEQFRPKAWPSGG
jgi:hypothetical protein